MIKPAKSRLLYLIFISCILSISGIMLGYDTSVIYGAAVIFSHDFHIDSFQSNMLVSILLTGAIIGAIFMGKLTDKFGRKKILLVAAILFIFGTILIAMANSLWQLYVFSSILALAIGIVSFAIPNYIAEISPANVRGHLVSIFQLFITIGVLLTFVANHYMYIDHLSWRVVFAGGVILAIIFLIGIVVLPESPRWLFLFGRDNDATKSLIKLHGNNYHVELAEIKSAVTKEQKTECFFSHSNLRLILIAVALNLLSAFCGIGAVVYLTPEIFSQLGKEAHPLHMMELISLINFIATLVGLILVDRLGRRKLWLIGSLFMIISLITLSINKFTTSSYAVIDITAIFTCVFAFAISSGLLSWLIIVEIFPLNFRGRGAAIGVSFNWLGNLLMIWLLPMAINSAPPSIIFSFFAFICFMAFIFYLKYLPETANLRLEKIEQFLRERQ